MTKPRPIDVTYEWCHECQFRTSHYVYRDGTLKCETCGTIHESDPGDGRSGPGYDLDEDDDQ